MSRELKYSGIEWIGDIPKEWEICRLKSISMIVRGGSPRPIEEYISETGYNWIKIGDTTKGNKYITSVRQKIKEEGLAKTRIVHEGELILTNSMSFGEPYILKIDGCIHDGWVAISQLRNVNKEFLYYSLCSPLCQNQFSLQVDGGVVKNLNVDKIAITNILLPPLKNQQIIADYLDKTCGEIDEMIALQETMIKELNAYKQSVITEAVTKGLNPNVPMKDSGINWIGEIPEHWMQYRIKYNTFLKGRIGWQGLNSSDFIDEGYCLITGTDFDNKGSVNWSSCYRISKERFDEDVLLHVKEGDLLMTKDGTVGKMAFIKELPEEASLNSHLLIIRQLSNLIDNSLLYWIMLSDVFKGFCSFYQSGAIMSSISQSTLGYFICYCAPLSEQHAIASYLEEKCCEIDSLIAVKQQKIEELKEYKKSVIYEYVTGKKEVV